MFATMLYFGYACHYDDAYAMLRYAARCFRRLCCRDAADKRRY